MLNTKEHEYLNKQGQQFLENQNIYSSNFGFPGLQMQPYAPIQSIVENMDSMDENAQVQSSKNTTLDKYENEFQKTLSEYNKTYQEMNEDHLKKTQSAKKSQQYLGKVISEEDGNYYYVNNYGITHKYSTDAWNNNNDNCPTTAIDASSKLFRQGPDMEPGQPCKLAGKNIRNKDTKEAAWIDIKGYKHVYPEDVWDKKSKSCYAKTINVDGSNYDLIPEGSPMNTTTICDTLDINPNALIRLKKLNKKLVQLARKISKEIEKMNVKDEVMKQLLNEQKKRIDVYAVKLDKDRQNLMRNQNALITIEGEQENTELNMTSNLYFYIFMMIFAILLVMITMKVSATNTITGKMLIFIIAAGLWWLYYMSKYMPTITF